MVDSIFLENTDCECDVTLDTWLKDALPLLPGVVRSVAKRQLILTCREFFEKTYAWRAVEENINAAAGDKQYWLSPYDQFANVIAILGVTYDNRHLQPIAAEPLKTTTSEAPQFYYAADPPDSFKLYPAPTAAKADAMNVLVALTPKPNVEHLPRLAFLKFYDALMDGFLARMYMHPNKPYTSADMAVMHRQKFLSAMSYYRSQSKQGYINAQGWHYPQNWQVRRFSV